MLRRILIALATAGTALILAGCGTAGFTYVPAVVGPLDDQEATTTVDVRIETDSSVAVIGQPIVFRVLIRNISTRSFWLPRDPDLLFTWIYPNGRRDNFLREFREERYYSERDAVRLKPGEELVKYFTIRTWYFDRPGITEFRAVMHASRNTNPELLPFWNGEVQSNSFGIDVKPSKTRRSFTDSRLPSGPQMDAVALVRPSA